MIKQIAVGVALIVAGTAMSGCSAIGQPSFNDVQHAREQSACAELGLDPGTGGFGQCVANLDASIFADTNSASH